MLGDILSEGGRIASKLDAVVAERDRLAKELAEAVALLALADKLRTVIELDNRDTAREACRQYDIALENSRLKKLLIEKGGE